MSVELQRPEACSRLSRAADEPIAATAPNPRAWLALEQPGPWGRKAPSSSQLDRELGAELDARAKTAGVTLVLIRRPGRLANQKQALPRTLLAAHPAAGWLERSSIDDPAVLLELDFGALASGAAPGLGQITDDCTVLVCTNGRRDLCCAEIGRARVTELAPTLGDALWESSHLGGHRFAPTVLILPSGVVLGRASTAQILAAVSGELPLAAYRGRSGLAAAAQAMEIAVLSTIGVGAAGSLHVDTPSGEGPWEVRVTHTDGRAWTGTVESRTGLERPDSCGREPEPAQNHVVRSLTETPG